MTSTNEDASAKSGRPIYLTPDNTALTLSEADAAIGAGENSRICISGFRDSSLTFLENFQNSVLLKELVITNCENIEVPNLAIFTQLTSLVLQDTKRKRVVDLSHLKYLEKMSGEWGKGWINTDCLLSLCDVHIFNGSAERLEDYDLPSSLTELAFTYGKLSSLEGVGKKLPKLKRLWFRKLPKVRSLSGIQDLKHLEKFTVEYLSNLQDYDALRYCSTVQSLVIGDCAAISNLDWLGSLERIEHLSFFGTKILNGDLSVLERMPKLSVIGFDNSSSYSHTAADIERFIAGRKQDTDLVGRASSLSCEFLSIEISGVGIFEFSKSAEGHWVFPIVVGDLELEVEFNVESQVMTKDLFNIVKDFIVNVDYFNTLAKENIFRHLLESGNVCASEMNSIESKLYKMIIEDLRDVPDAPMSRLVNTLQYLKLVGIGLYPDSKDYLAVFDFSIEGIGSEYVYAAEFGCEGKFMSVSLVSSV